MTTRTKRPPAESFTDLIGGTPLVRLDFGPAAVATTYAKLESVNPLASVKDRAALSMIDGAELRGELCRGTSTVVEASSGNTGIALAALCAVRGYACVIVLPDDVTAERIHVLRSFGAEVVLSPYRDGYAAAVALAEKIHRERPDSWYVRQHENPDNVRAHYTTTGPEIWADLDGKIDLLVCGYGTGGTLTGCAHYLKEQNPDVRVVAVEPDRSPLLSKGVGGLHDIPGLNGGFLTSTTDVNCIDEVVTVSDDDARSAARLLARTAGLLVGISSGAAAHACRTLATRPGQAGKTIVTVFPDTGERYLSALVPQESIPAHE